MAAYVAWSSLEMSWPQVLLAGPETGAGPQLPRGAAEPPEQPAWGPGDPGEPVGAGLRPRACPLPEQGASVLLELSMSVPPRACQLSLPPSAQQPHNPWVPVPGDGLPMTDRASLLVQSSQSVTFVKGKGPLSPQRLSVLLRKCRPYLEYHSFPDSKC